MEFMQGGDLRRVLDDYSRFEVEETRFYCAEIILGLQFLHEN